MNVHEEAPPPLPDWLAETMPFRRRALRVDGQRIHFIDDGAGPAVLLMHGNPTWSFLWRRVIARLLPRGVRVIAPDLVGFGLSDKPLHARTHSLDGHIRSMVHLVKALDLHDVTIVGQDWGGPIVAGVAAREPERIRGAVYANTAVLAPRRPLRPTMFHRFSHVPLVSDVVFRGLGFPLQVLGFVQGDRGSIGTLERRAYAFPFARIIDRAGPVALARMVPDRDDHPSLPILDEIERWVRAFDGPVGLVWGVRDPILGRALKRMREALPNARVVETDAGHFLQEEVPGPLAEMIVDVVKRS